MAIWNPWHGCHKISAGCLHCYMFRRDESFGKDSTVISKTAQFRLPLARRKNGDYKLQDDVVYTCMTSDFFLEEADEWRAEAWQMIAQRQDLHFFIITKRIDRFAVQLPADWGEGYAHVSICVTCENQAMADLRIPLLLAQPIRHRKLIHEPLLTDIDIAPYLATGKIESVLCGGESGDDARVCDFDWVRHLAAQSAAYRTPFHFKQTGAHFRKDGKIYRIPRHLQMIQAQKAGLNSSPEETS